MQRATERSNKNGSRVKKWTEAKIDYAKLMLDDFCKPFLGRKGFWSQNATFFIDDWYLLIDPCPKNKNKN
jgi:hypothetical protein